MLALYISGISTDFLSYPMQFIIQFLLGIIALRVFGKEAWRTGPTLRRIVIASILIFEHAVALTDSSYLSSWTIALDNGLITAMFYRWLSGFDQHMRTRAVCIYLIHMVIWQLVLLFAFGFLRWSILDSVFVGFFWAMISTMLWPKVLEFWARLHMLIGFLKNT